MPAESRIPRESSEPIEKCKVRIASDEHYTNLTNNSLYVCRLLGVRSEFSRHSLGNYECL